MAGDPKRMAAEAALDEVQPGMRLGLGTGSTAKHFVDLIGEKVAQGFDCRCVPTSVATETQARELGIPLATLDELPELDLTVDGADEIGPQLSLIKGGGGALLREKIVACASARMVVIADKSKIVGALGRFPLPIEVNPFGLGATARAVEKLMAQFGAEGGLRLRRNSAGEVFTTDGGHYILDALFGRISQAEALSDGLLDIAGVVQHGLFLKLCSAAYVADETGVQRYGA